MRLSCIDRFGRRSLAQGVPVMTFPTATRTTAFVSGASLTALSVCLGVLKSRGLIPHSGDDPELFPVIGAYFLVTGIVFVLGFRNPRGLPTSRADWRLLFNCWGRMLAWLLGAGSISALVAVAHLLRWL
jgi:hypothetical protein